MRKLQDINAERARAEADDRDPRSRSDARSERMAESDRLMRLARTLCELPEKQLRKLELPELVADAVHDARCIDSPSARNRQLKIVRRHLGQVDVERLEQTVESVIHPVGPLKQPPKVDKVLELYEQLRAGGDQAVFDFCSAHTELDRTELRTLLRAAEKQRLAKPEIAPGKLPSVRRLLDRLRRYAGTDGSVGVANPRA